MDRFLYALGIRHVGEKAAEDIAAAFGTFDEFVDLIDSCSPEEECPGMRCPFKYCLDMINLSRSAKRHSRCRTQGV